MRDEPVPPQGPTFGLSEIGQRVLYRPYKGAPGITTGGPVIGERDGFGLRQANFHRRLVGLGLHLVADSR
jgi:hypothetical protein